MQTLFMFDTKFAPTETEENPDPVQVYIGRCACKTCKHTKTLSGPQSHGFLPTQTLGADWGKCPKCSRWTITWRKIEGKKTAHKCDVRCTTATGHKCECSCGGANHGAAYL